jgi:Fe-Mn family superoxide dismutase
MAYEVKNFSHLIEELNGFLSEKQLEAHFKLYEGYVKKLNEIEKKLDSSDPSKANYSFNEFSELKRREAVAFNGAFLHELYFENLGNKNTELSGKLKTDIDKRFGSLDNLYANLKGIAISEPGWAILTYNRVDKQLHTYLLEEHHIGLPVHQELLLVIDSWEHAYMIDYGISKDQYMEKIINKINWEIVNERYSRLSRKGTENVDVSFRE